MNTKKVILISLVALAFLAFFIVSDAKNKSGGGGAISQNILYITQPVMSFSGVVEKIEGNKITVTQKQMAVQTYAPPAIAAATTQTMPSPLPTPKTIVVTFKPQYQTILKFLNLSLILTISLKQLLQLRS